MVTLVVCFEIAFIQPAEAVKIIYSHEHNDSVYSVLELIQFIWVSKVSMLFWFESAFIQSAEAVKISYSQDLKDLCLLCWN